MSKWKRIGLYGAVAAVIALAALTEAAAVQAAEAAAVSRGGGTHGFDAEYKYTQGPAESLSGAQARLMLGVQIVAAERAGAMLESLPEMASRSWSKEMLQAAGLALTEIQVISKNDRSEDMTVKFHGTTHLENVSSLAESRQTLEMWQKLLRDNRQLLAQNKALQQKWDAADKNQRRSLTKEMILNDRRARANEWYEQGNRWNERREFDKAIEFYNRALVMNEQFAECLSQRGDAYDDKGDYEEAIANYTKAIEQDSKNAVFYSNRGVAHRHKGDLAAALEDYNQALQLDANCADAYTNRAAVYNFQGQFDKCIADATQALRLNPQDADAYNNRSVAYLGQGKPEAAIADCEQALRIDSQYAYAYYNKAVALERAGRKLEATEAYRGFLHYAAADDPLTRTVKQYLQKGNE